VKIIQVSFYVSGPGRFPIDMLRYDGVVPSTETDAARIERSIEGTGSEHKTVSVTKLDGYKFWTPNADRWKSFGWTVGDITEGR
jgi:hypothetical protein